MTVTVKVHVNGNYRCAVQQDGNDVVLVGPNEERSFSPPHPVDSTFRVGPEEYLGDTTKVAEDASAKSVGEAG
jgi:hypothetical protein